MKNLQANPKVGLSFIDISVQKGFKVGGNARYVTPTDEEFSAWAAPLQAMAGDRYPIQGVIVVKVLAVESIVAPSYKFYPDETTERSQIESALRTYGVGESHW